MPKATLRDRFSKAWNIFSNPSAYEKDVNSGKIAPVSATTVRPDRAQLHPGTERSIISSIYTRLAVDVAAIAIKHVRVDQNGYFLDTINSPLNDCLNVEANIDQSGRELIFDTVLTMFEEGHAAIVPVDTDLDTTNSSFDIYSMRVGKVVQWRPRDVTVSVYNDRTGLYQDVVMPKQSVAIIQNPLYSVMNEPNSTLKRLKYKLAILDAIDDNSSSKKMNLIVQLPYAVKSETRKQQAANRLNNLTEQLGQSEYGIAYIDATEKIVQLNRSIENDLLPQIEYLTKTLYSQLGLTEEVFNGNADEKVMLNYYSRTIEPILSSITDELRRKFLTKTARSQGQDIKFFRDMFKLVPLAQLGDILEKFTRNEIVSSNESRGVLGLEPRDTERANELLNKNINPEAAMQGGDPAMDASTDPVGSALNQLMASLGGGGEIQSSIPTDSSMEEGINASLNELEEEDDEQANEDLDAIESILDDLDERELTEVQERISTMEVDNEMSELEMLQQAVYDMRKSQPVKYEPPDEEE